MCVKTYKTCQIQNLLSLPQNVGYCIQYISTCPRLKTHPLFSSTCPCLWKFIRPETETTLWDRPWGNNPRLARFSLSHSVLQCYHDLWQDHESDRAVVNQAHKGGGGYGTGVKQIHMETFGSGFMSGTTSSQGSAYFFPFNLLHFILSHNRSHLRLDHMFGSDQKHKAD